MYPKPPCRKYNHSAIYFFTKINFSWTIKNVTTIIGTIPIYLQLIKQKLVMEVFGENKREDRDRIFEFYLIEPFRKFASTVFLKFIEASKVSFIECQSNDLLLSTNVV